MRTINSLKSLLFVFPLIILISCFTLSPVNEKAVSPNSAVRPETVIPDWAPFAEGIAYYAGKVSNPRIEFHALKIDLFNQQLRIVAAAGAGSADRVLSTRVSTFVYANDLLAGINALPFDPVSGKEGEPRTNAGIVITDGLLISPPHPGFDALVFYSDGGAAIVSQSEIHPPEGIVNAVGGFMRILELNELVPRVLNLTARHPRSAAGISPDGRFLFLLVIDGRRPGSVGCTEAETALVLRSLGASEGINLDGGGSTALAMRYPDGKVRVVNTPVHGGIPGRERAVAGCLGVGKR